MNSAVDMSQFIAPKSDQLNSDDLIGGPRTITITRVTGNEGNAEQPVNIFYAEDEAHPFRPCKSMRRVMVKIWGADASKYVGRSMTLYRDPKVKWGGMEVGGIRISHMTGLDKPETMALTETRSARKPYTVQPLKDVPAPSGKDEAREWTDKFVTNVGRAPDAGKLDAFVAGKKEMLDKLEMERADLHAECQAAINSRAASFAQADEDDPFADEPGDAVTDWTTFVAGINGRISAATTGDQLDAILTDINDAGPPDSEVAALDAAIGKKRRELAKG
jgi:hypothetical protein